MFCTYLTTYSGDKLPSKYIGSSSLKRVMNGYHGTVLSKKWKPTWDEELQKNPDLFHTIPLTLHDDREAAIETELELQKLNDVVKSTEWINESFAQPQGFFGRDVSGDNNPMYGNGDKLVQYYKNLSEEEYEKVCERNRLSAYKQWENADERREQTKKTLGNARDKWRKENPEEFSEQQRKKSHLGNESIRNNKCIHLEYKGKVYRGYSEMVRETGITKFFIQKMIKNNEIIVVKKPR